MYRQRRADIERRSYGGHAALAVAIALSLALAWSAGDSQGGQSGSPGAAVSNAGAGGTQTGGRSLTGIVRDQGGAGRLQPQTIPAFPEARGCGALALAPSRSLPLRVHFVTNTDNDGPGSLRAAWESVDRDFYDVIIFRTGGRIVLDEGDDLWIGGGSQQDPPWPDPVHAHVYIAGQTAPGGGLTIARRRFGTLRDSNHVVMRYLTFRKNVTNFNQATTAIVDHVSVNWTGTSDAGGFNAFNAGNVHANDAPADTATAFYTVSNTLMAEPESHHPTIMNPTGRCGSIYGNVWQGPGHRFPWVQTTPMDGGVEFVNNVVYNWSGGSSQARSTASLHAVNVDYVANYHMPGPATNLDIPAVAYPFYLLTQCFEPGGCDPSNVQIHVSGNRNHRNNFDASVPPDDAWRGSMKQFACGREAQGDLNPECEGGAGADVPLDYKRDTPLSLGDPWPYQRLAMTDTQIDSILELAGNSRGLACDGSWFDRRDALDSLYVQQFMDGTGLSSVLTLYDNPNLNPDPDEEPAVVPTPAAGTPCADTDEDGMPDAWESIHCGSITGCQADAVTTSGYLMIEHYLNGSDPNDATPWDPAPADALTPVADAYVQGGSEADTNFGTADSLRVKTASASFSRWTYLKFDLSGVAAVGAATLRLFARVAESEVIDTSVFAVANTSWSETGITWNNKPALGGTPLDTISVGGDFQWYDLDVTSYIQNELAAGRTTIGLGLRNPTTSSQIILAHSRENANQPELVLTGMTLGTD
ncbi:MAG: DNRLRE domain-containing protein [Luteitalea sp.]|nr:DNRLRE domain-containing protein [Luteitalea sp.]